jgi:hypothetical protein
MGVLKQRSAPNKHKLSASMSDKNIEVWEGMRRVTAQKLP